MRDEEAWAAEEELWTGGAERMAAALDATCLMVFPGPAGIMDAGAAVEGLRQAPRWRRVTMRERHLARPSEDLVVLAYRARGERDGAADYEAACSSTYRRAGDGWALVQHQQTPA